MMKQGLLIILLFFQLFSHGQRSKRNNQSLVTTYQPDSFAGHYLKITLTNSDTVPVLLRLGPGKRIENNDTLSLARMYPCNNPSVGEYYDLDYLVSEEINCVRWYTLQLIKPKDTLQFILKLKDFLAGDTTRLYSCFTKEITKMDKELNLYSDPKSIIIMKDVRNFKTTYINVAVATPNMVVLQ
jgi:hypothetical protein